VKLKAKSMSYICQICEKKNVMGNSKSHKRGVAGKRWKKRAPVTPRLFEANLQKVTVTIAGESKQMRLCTKCIKRIKKYKAIGDYKNIVVA
jgi:ribosomal protein L28